MSSRVPWKSLRKITIDECTFISAVHLKSVLQMASNVDTLQILDNREAFHRLIFRNIDQLGSQINDQVNLSLKSLHFCFIFAWIDQIHLFQWFNINIPKCSTFLSIIIKSFAELKNNLHKYLFFRWWMDIETISNSISTKSNDKTYRWSSLSTDWFDERTCFTPINICRWRDKSKTMFSRFNSKTTFSISTKSSISNEICSLVCSNLALRSHCVMKINECCFCVQ